MIRKQGLGSYTKSHTQPQDQVGFKGGGYKAVRVARVITDSHSYPELFKKYGEWGSLGVIFYTPIENPLESFVEENVAFPLFSNIKNYPLVNEIVIILDLPDMGLYESVGSFKKYYIGPLNVFNNSHHNATPDNIFNESLNDLELGEYFKEKSEIKNLKSFEGDVLYEGRWGNSIRLGCTTQNIKENNEWSEHGKTGDPITIIRNGQPLKIDGESWIPISEKINEDLSSVYLTSNQKINIKVSSSNYRSYEDPPIGPDSYTDPQIILNSDRILINAKKDSVLVASNKSINLNTKETTNIDSEEGVIINSPNIYLGDKRADEPLILGNKTKKLLEDILDEMLKVTEQLSVLTSLPPGVPFAPLNIQSTVSNNKLRTYKNQISRILSKRNYTK